MFDGCAEVEDWTPTRPTGRVIKLARKGSGEYVVTIHGRSAHQGVEPELGINAVVEAAHQILEVMNETIDKPREELSPYAPRIQTIMIDPEKIGLIIGPGGKTIKAIQEQTGEDSTLPEEEPPLPDEGLDPALQNLPEDALLGGGDVTPVTPWLRWIWLLITPLIVLAVIGLLYFRSVFELWSADALVAPAVIGLAIGFTVMTGAFAVGGVSLVEIPVLVVGELDDRCRLEEDGGDDVDQHRRQTDRKLDGELQADPDARDVVEQGAGDDVGDLGALTSFGATNVPVVPRTGQWPRATAVASQKPDANHDDHGAAGNPEEREGQGAEAVQEKSRRDHGYYIGDERRKGQDEPGLEPFLQRGPGHHGRVGARGQSGKNPEDDSSENGGSQRARFPPPATAAVRRAGCQCSRNPRPQAGAAPCSCRSPTGR